MSHNRVRDAFRALLLCALVSGTAVAQGEEPGPARPSQSVHGTLVSVDAKRLGVIVRTERGPVAWKLEKAVVDRLTPFKAGDPIVIIYRSRGGDKVVTAVAFPGAAQAPIYVNTSGQRVQLVGGAMVNGACGQPSETPVSTTVIPVGSQAEIAGACWCCAPADGTCVPANRTGAGIAFLTNCYE